MPKPMLATAMLAALFLLPAAAPQRVDSQRTAWNRPLAPFRLIGNVHYVGTAGLSAYLVTTPRGHILIDGALPESADQIAANIRALGFKLRDVRYLLINHAHYDHAGGLAALKRATGATLAASAGDTPTLQAGHALERNDLADFPAVRVDRTVIDGDVVSIGSMTLTAHLTPGHTKGCTSWTMTTRDPAVRGGGPIRVIFACSVSVAGQKLVGNPRYPQAAADFRSSFARLLRLKADVFVNFHGEGFDLAGKRAKLLAGDRAAFVDPAELPRRIREARADFALELARQRAAVRGARGQ